MRILRVRIENFRGIESADIELPNHALLVGPNNACKSTVLEALNLVLGPDRASGTDVIDEHDFFRGNYRVAVPDSDPNDSDEEAAAEPTDESSEGPSGEGAAVAAEPERATVAERGELEDGEGDEEGEIETNAEEPPKIIIEVTLGNLGESHLQRFRGHLDPWNEEEGRLYTPEELADYEPDSNEYVLRVGFRGWYEAEEDEFRTQTYFLTPERADGEHERFGRRSKQEIGFLYLRSLRTGRRAASLERGSLLDILLREKLSRPRLWETILQGLEETGRTLEGNQELRDALDSIQTRIEGLIPLADNSEPSSTLRPGRLTRRHLRQTITYFLASRDSDHPLPFDRLGSGTSNVLVFALLSAIADAKNNVIFAMEEPEIALPPHTQRVIIQRLKDISAQAIVSSHSPYVGELFLPDALVVLKRREDGELSTAAPLVGQGVKEKTLRRDFRTRFAEGLLARSVVIVEGITEFWGLPAAVDVLAGTNDTAFKSFDRDGLVFIPAHGSGELEKLAEYFDSLGIPPFVVCDELEDYEIESLTESARLVIEHPYSGFERLLSEELEFSVIRRLVDEWQGWRDYPRHLSEPDEDSEEEEWREYFFEVLRSRKGEGYSERVLSRCQPEELPITVIDTISSIGTAVGRPPLPASDPLASVLPSDEAAEPGSEEATLES